MRTISSDERTGISREITSDRPDRNPDNRTGEQDNEDLEDRTVRLGCEPVADRLDMSTNR